MNSSTRDTFPNKRKRLLSPVAASSSRRGKIARTNITAEDRVALTQHQPQAVDSQHTPGERSETGFRFGNPRAHASFTFVPTSHTLPEATPAATMALRGPETTFITFSGDTSADLPSRGSAVIATPPSNGIALDSIDEDQMAITTPVVTKPFYVVCGEDPFVPQQVPTGSAEVFGSLLTPTGREPAPVGEVEDDTRTELSYVSFEDQDRARRAITGKTNDEDQYITDPSVGTPFSDHSTIVGRTMPHVPISSRQHSAYQAQINPQATDQPAVVKTEDSPPAHARGLPRGLGRDPTPSRAIRDRRPSGRFVNRSPANVEGHHVPDIPHSVAAGIANSPAVNPNRNNLASADNSMDDDITPPHAPRRRVRTRGVFIIGGGAHIRIDEGIEVHLKEGADGQVDFII